jgi:hypothetical protein
METNIYYKSVIRLIYDKTAKVRHFIGCGTDFVPRLRQLVMDLHCRAGFDCRPDHMDFVVNHTTPGQVFLQPSYYQRSILIHSSITDAK